VVTCAACGDSGSASRTPIGRGAIMPSHIRFAMSRTTASVRKVRCGQALALTGLLLSARAGLAVPPMEPNDIQTTFFNGQPFTVTALTRAK
jgi:hypothetical protein